MKNIIMAAELGLLSLTQLQKLAQQQQQKIQANLQEASAAVRSSSSSTISKKNIINKNNNNYNWMWNPKHHQEHQENQEEVEEEEEEDEDSWEVKAFEQDTTGNNIVTWPPRSYTCTFCRREFRSAQALGGHMNVHRRDRARLHQTLPTPTPTPTASTSSTTLLIPAQEFGGGLCVLYSLPNPNAVNNSCMDSPSTTTVLSISPFEPNNLVAPLFPNPNSSSSNNIIDNGEIKMEDSSTNEELDLELRLGRR